MNGAMISADQPAAALLADLKVRGMLQDTLVVWGGEFGRTSDSQGSVGRGDSWGDPLFDDDLPRWRPNRGREQEVEVEEVSQDLPAFVKGERVSHKRFGSGTIEAVNGQGRDAKVTVKFDDEETGTKKLVVAFAGLERGSD